MNFTHCHAWTEEWPRNQISGLYQPPVSAAWHRCPKNSSNAENGLLLFFISSSSNISRVWFFLVSHYFQDYFFRFPFISNFRKRERESEFDKSVWLIRKRERLPEEQKRAVKDRRYSLGIRSIQLFDRVVLRISGLKAYTPDHQQILWDYFFSHRNDPKWFEKLNPVWQPLCVLIKSDKLW